MKKKIIALVSLLLIGIAAKSICNATEMLQRTNFKERISLPWHVWEKEKGYTLTDAYSGIYSVYIEPSVTNACDIAVRHNEISIKKGHKYNVKFSLESSDDRKVYVRIGDASDQYNDAWNNNCIAFDAKRSEILEVDDSFIAEKDIPNAEFAFWIGGGNGKYSSTIDFFSMSLDDPEFIPTPAPIQNEYDIHVNQLGYYTNGEKKAVFDYILKESDDTNDCVIKDKDGKVVYTCAIIPFGKDLASGDVLNICDFSGFTTPGKGYTVCCRNSKSLPFDIGSDIYSSMKSDAIKYFYHSRSGTDITMPYCVESQWERQADNLTDKPGLKKDVEYEGPSYIDATGGWSTDDHDKYIINGGLALWLLQNQYEFALKKGDADRFGDKCLNIPESGNGYPDLLDEARWQMEWMLKMQIPEGYDRAGMAAHKVTDEWVNSFPEKLGRFYYPPSTAATLNLAACAAQAARLWKDIDADFSDKCLAAAETAWNAALENPSVFVTLNGDPESETYKDNNVEDEFYWAGCELYLTTKKTNYLEKIKSSDCFCKIPTFSYENNGAFDWSSTSALGTLSLALVEGDEFQQAKESILNSADVFWKIGMYEGYGVTLPISTFLTEYKDIKYTVENGYPIFSNQIILNNSIILAYAYELKKDSKYIGVARDTLDYICGRNPIDKCYVTGYGSNPVKSPYQKFNTYAVEPTFANVQRGYVVSGPTHTDFVARAGMNIKTTPVQKDYYDSIHSDLTNRVSASLNAALSWITDYSEQYADALCVDTRIHKEDINMDGCVNMIDAMAIARTFGTVKTEERYDPKCDLNGDYCINMVDVVYIAKFFGNTYMD